MLDIAKELQNEKVKNLVDIYSTGQESIVFKSPTGSGKTHMMGDLANRIIGLDPDTVFLISSLSKGNIAIQNYENFLQYKNSGEFSLLNPFLISSDNNTEGKLYIPTIYNVYFLPRDLYKKNSKLMEGPMLSFLEELKSKNKTIIHIKDECHIDSKNLDSLVDYFGCVFHFSATPNLERGQYPDVEMKEEEAINAKIIKRIKWHSEDYNFDDDYETNNEKCLTDALNYFVSKRKTIRNELNINPCFIIQISNKDKAEEELELIFKTLSKFADLHWICLLNDKNECKTNDTSYQNIPKNKWSDEVKQNLSTIDVIIFKMVISEGWDIRRASMLYQIRDSKSKQLDDQVVGRVRRNPRLLDFENLTDDQQELCLLADVWGMKEKENREFISVRLKSDIANIVSDIQVKTTSLQSLYKTGYKLDEFLKDKSEPTVPSSIFDLGKKLESSNNGVNKMIQEYADSYEKWFKATENITEIIKLDNDYSHDYSHLVCDPKAVSFSETSYFEKTNQYVCIDDSVWERNDGDNEFHFDSDAEKKWAKILCGLKTEIEKATPTLLGVGQTVLLWGKNYYPNSQIGFDYYSSGVHKSYPDFILKDTHGVVHLFEVKSLNGDSGNLDSEEYKNKIADLKEAYKYASKITNQVFYLPILKLSTWTLLRYKNGIEDTIDITIFKESLK